MESPSIDTPGPEMESSASRRRPRDPEPPDLETSEASLAQEEALVEEPGYGHGV